MTSSSYCPSWKEYFALMRGPRLGCDMFQCDQADWQKTYTDWNIVYVLGLIFLAVFRLILGCILILSFAGAINVGAFLAIFIALTILFLALDVVLTHLSWFCVVKQNGCCGKVGYFIWAFVHFLLFWLPWCWYDNSILLNLLLLVPLVYMMISLVRLGISENKSPPTEAKVWESSPVEAKVVEPSANLTSPGAQILGTPQEMGDNAMV